MYPSEIYDHSLGMFSHAKVVYWLRFIHVKVVMQQGSHDENLNKKYILIKYDTKQYKIGYIIIF